MRVISADFFWFSLKTPIFGNKNLIFIIYFLIQGNQFIINFV